MTDIEASLQQQQQQLQHVHRMHQASCLQELQQQLSAQFASGRFVTTQQQQQLEQEQEQAHQGASETTAVPSSLVPFLPFMHPSLALMPGHMRNQPPFSHSHNHHHHVHKLAMQPMWPNPAVAAAHIQAALAAAAVAATTASSNNNNNTPNPAIANKTNKREEDGSAGIVDTVSILESPQNVAKYQSHSHSTPPDSPQARCQSTEDGFISMKSSSPEQLNQSDAQNSEMDAPLNLSKPKVSPRSSPSSTYVKDREQTLTPIVPSPPLSWQTAGTSVSASGLPHQHPSTALFADVEANYLQSRVSQ